MPRDEFVRILEERYSIPYHIIKSFLEFTDEHSTERACEMIWRGDNPARVKSLLAQGKKLTSYRSAR